MRLPDGRYLYDDREDAPHFIISNFYKSIMIFLWTKNKKKSFQFYKPVDYNNDIAIIELETPVEFNDFIKPLCLPAADSYLDPETPGTVCVAAGWGADSFKKSSYPNKLHEVDINLIERKTCNQIPGYENMVTNKMFCAGHLEGKQKILETTVN